MITSQDSVRVSNVWRKAALKLRIRIEMPFTLVANGRTYTWLVRLPTFGGPKGILLAPTAPPAFEIDTTMLELAQEHGYGCSFLNVEEYLDYDEVTVKDALREWGYTGPPGDEPSWLKDDTNSETR